MDKYLQEYLITALWSSTDDSDRPLDENYDITDIDNQSIQQAKKDMSDFETKASALYNLDILDMPIGHDFWLTRNGHGSGFWDGDYPEEIGESLTKLSKEFKEVNLTIGDNGKLYFV